MLTAAQCKQLTTEMFVLGSLTGTPVSKILELLVVADELYFNDEESFIEDHQYDALKMYARNLAPADSYFTGVGSSVRGGKVDLPFKMGSLNQVYQGDYVKWVAESRIENESVIISDKLDGASAMIVYHPTGSLQIAFSRGDGIQGADITRHARQIHNVPQQIDTCNTVTIRAENIIPPTKFHAINNGKYSRGGRIYKNPRNMVSGLMNSSENHPEVYKAIDTVAYEIVGSTLSKSDQLKQLAEWGFTVVNYSIGVGGYWNDDRLTKLLNDRRAVSIYELDGVVIDIDSQKVREQLKTDELNPKYAVKFKVADASNFAIATVKQVEWNLSKDGYYKPRVQIEPVDLVGVTIQNLTGFNAKFIKDSRIGPGAQIQITRAGDVIPLILGVVKGVEPQMPDDDDAVWTESGVDLVLLDATSNDVVKFARLNDFFSSLDVPHLGEGNLQQMFEMGFDSPESIIPLTQQDIGNLVRSQPIGKKIFTGLRERLTNVPIYVLMGSHSSLGRGVGKRKMKKLWDAFEGDMTKCASVDLIVSVDGFEQKTAMKISRGYPAFMEFFAKIEQYVTIAPYVAVKIGGLSGETIVMTGFRDKELEQRIESLGGKIGSSVSAKTTTVIAADPRSDSSKLAKARSLNIPIMSRDEFLTRL